VLLNDENKQKLAAIIPARYNAGQLLYRGSDHGFGADQFHARCNNQGTTFVVCKAKNCNNIFGGFTEIQWSSANNWKNGATEGVANKSFLFVIPNGNQNVQKFEVTSGGNDAYSNREREIFDYSGYGPTFGGGYDLCLHANCNANSNSFSNSSNGARSYGLPDDNILAGSRSFQVENYEVFKLS